MSSATKKEEYISLFSNTVSVWCADGMFWVSAKFGGKSKALIRPFSFKYTTKKSNMLYPKFPGVEIYVRSFIPFFGISMLIVLFVVLQGRRKGQ
jgi:hypothetical protein